MRCEQIDPLNLDEDLATRLADITTRDELADNSAGVPVSADSVRLRLQYGSDNRPADRVWLALDDSDSPVGYASLDLSHWDNLQLAFAGCRVDPDVWGRGIGTLLLQQQIAAAKELGRTSLTGWINADGAAERLLVENGFVIGQRGVGRRIDPQASDPHRLQGLIDDAAAHARDYEIVRLEGPAPEDMLPTLTAVFAAINDAPLDDLDWEPDVFTPERLRTYDQAMAARRQRVFRMLARQRQTGEWAGHTILCVDETRPGHAFQEDTSVVRTHRGHRLGMLLKASMLLWIREARPDVRTIDTWNAASNDHMIAVNERLGCHVAQHSLGVQLSL